MIDAILTNTVLPEVSRKILMSLMEGAPVSRVHAGVSNGEFTYSFD